MYNILHKLRNTLTNNKKVIIMYLVAILKGKGTYTTANLVEIKSFPTYEDRDVFIKVT